MRPAKYYDPIISTSGKYNPNLSRNYIKIYFHKMHFMYNDKINVNY